MHAYGMIVDESSNATISRVIYAKYTLTIDEVWAIPYKIEFL